jgi:hypothetical protein
MAESGDEKRGAFALAGSLLGVGLVARIAPLFDQGGRLLQQFPTEDGYLMLTIARNLGIGNGMSIAAGTIPTNGTQPLTTILWSGVFALVDGDKNLGVAGVQILEIVIGLLAAFMLFAVGRRVFDGMPAGDGGAALAAAAWFASAQTTRHGMNCLESGTYALAILVFVWALLRAADGAPSRPALLRWAGLGAILGVTFWVRVDAVLLCGALGLSHLGGWLPCWRGRFAARFAELAAAGSACAAIAAPWLLHNLLRFGSIMPVSGQSEGHAVGFGQELVLVPAKLLEYVMVILAVPASMETHPVLVAGAVAILAAVAVAASRALASASDAARTTGLLAAGFGAALVVFYGLFFGAGHFMSRYLFPISPFLALLTTAAALHAVRLRPRLAGVASVAVLVLVAGLQARVYLGGSAHEHFQVVGWVEANVPDATWVGAVQTGTLGFFHDRTINLPSTWPNPTSNTWRTGSASSPGPTATPPSPSISRCSWRTRKRTWACSGDPRLPARGTAALRRSPTPASHPSRERGRGRKA